MRIAIVGGGIAGLVAAHELSRHHQVVLFEADHRVGGHTHTVTTQHEGQAWSVDTGFVVFNRRTYPHFCRLLDSLGVSSRISDMSFSVRHEARDVEWNGHSLNQIFAQRRNALRPSFLSLLKQIARFQRDAPGVLAEGQGTETITEFLQRGGYNQHFVDLYLAPLGAALWSCPPQQFLSFPVRFFVAFLVNHGMLSWHGRPEWLTIVGGSREYLEPLTRPFHLPDSV